MTKTEVKSKIKPNLDIAEPNMYRVIYINDEVTTVEFVIGTLLEHFNYEQSAALEITNKINDEGSAVVAILPYEIAEQKGIEVTADARNKGFPLQVKLEANI